MAYDEALATRIRTLLPDGVEVAERTMFGGLAFLVGGHLAVAASGSAGGGSSGGGLMVRCDPDATAEAVAEAGVARVVMRGRALDGWLRIEAGLLTDDATLRRWVETGTTYAAALPPR